MYSEKIYNFSWWAEKSVTQASLRDLKSTIQVANPVTRMGLSLRNIFAAKNIDFDIEQFNSSVKNAVQPIIQEPRIPVEARVKFMEDLEKRLAHLKHLSVGDVQNLKSRRAIESLWVESIELQTKYGNDSAKKDEFILQKIIDKNIADYVEPVIHSLYQTYVVPTKQEFGVSYQKVAVESFFQNIAQIDRRSGVDFSGVIATFRQNGTLKDLRQDELFRIVRVYLFEKFAEKDPDWFGQETKILRQTLRSNSAFQIVNDRSYPGWKTGFFIRLLRSIEGL